MVGAADPESLVAMVREREVDVVTVQELTYQEADALKAAGLDEVLSHQFLVPYTDGGGGGQESTVAFHSPIRVASTDSHPKRCPQN